MQGLPSRTWQLLSENIARFLRWFTRPSARFGWGVIALAGLSVGAVLPMGFKSFVEATNDTDFCVSCHEMRWVDREYRNSSHYRNRTGVEVTCSDCHVPEAGWPMMVRKVLAARDLYHSLLGSIDTEEKFEAKRLELARMVWRYMRDSGSRECRNCHAFPSMDSGAQSRRAREKHAEAREARKTCIDCHKGVAHKLPRDHDEDD